MATAGGSRGGAPDEVSPVDVRRLDPVPPGRVCPSCGGEVRFSHLAYLGRGERAAVQVCRGCGLAYRGGVRDAGAEPATGGRGGRGKAGAAAQPQPSRRRRPLPDEGAPDNPVLDEDLAARLRERFGSG